MIRFTFARHFCALVSSVSWKSPSSLGSIAYSRSGTCCKRKAVRSSSALIRPSAGYSKTFRKGLLLLPPKTESVWTFLKDQTALAGAVLVGGSALALRIQHRLSEDLDLVFCAPTLPRAGLDALRRIALTNKFNLQQDDDEAAVHEFSNGGLELHDYQQDFLVNGGVKLSFFVAEAPLASVLAAPAEEKVRVATIKELFRSKCLVSAVRSKTRDWLDLYILLREHGFSIRDYQAAFRDAGVPTQCDIGLSRLCSGVPQRNDEGYAHLLKNPPSVDEMRAFFIAQRNKLEIDAAAEQLRERQRR